MNAWLTEQSIDVEGIVAKFTAPTTEAMRQTWAEHMRYAGSDHAFAVWLAFVDRRLRAITGCSIYDLPDFAWRDEYDADASPREAVRSFAASEPF